MPPYTPQRRVHQGGRLVFSHLWRQAGEIIAGEINSRIPLLSLLVALMFLRTQVVLLSPLRHGQPLPEALAAVPPPSVPQHRPRPGLRLRSGVQMGRAQHRLQLLPRFQVV